MDLDMVLLFIAKVRSRRMSAFLSLHLISGKDKGYFRYIGMLQLFFCFYITVAKYCSSTLEIVYYTAAD